MSLERMSSARIVFEADGAGGGGGAGNQGEIVKAEPTTNPAPDVSMLGGLDIGSGTLYGEVQPAKRGRKSKKRNGGSDDLAGLNAFMNGY